MKMPFLWLALGFSVGIVLEKYGDIPALWPACVLGPGLILLWFLRGRRFFLLLFVLCLSCAGFLWARLDAHVPVNAVQNYVGPERITLRGVVDTLPEIKTRGKKTTVSLVLKAKSITWKDRERWKFRKVRGYVQVFLLQSPVLPQVGDELRLYGELSAPRTVLNPGEFDYGKFLAQKNIHAIFQTIGKKSVRVIRTGDPWNPSRFIANARRYFASIVDKIYQPREAAIVKALVLGLRGDVAPEIRSQFMKTGTIHLLAISGMNITMIAGTFFVIFLFCGIGFRPAAFVTLGIVILYVGLAGAGVPIQRAGCGAMLVLVAALVGRPPHLLNSLCCAFFAILLWNPQSLWSVGFQLSFLCVLSLILILPLFARFGAWMLSLGSSIAVLLGTFPAVLYYFNIFSPVSVLANIVAIPLCDAALFTSLFALLFSGIPLLNTALIKISSWIIGASLAWIKCLSEWRWGYWFLERPSLAGLAAYYIIFGAILFFQKRSFCRKHFVMTALAAGWLVVSVFFLSGFGRKGFELTMLASGKNQIAHAHFSNGAEWVINAGRNFPSDQGEWLVAPYLRSRGIGELEGVLLTDFSRKHTGGLASILRDFPARFLLCPVVFSYALKELYKNLPMLGRKGKIYRTGDEVQMGDEKIRIIAQSGKGVALRFEAGPWRIIFISCWDQELFTGLLDRGGEHQIHAVLLPPLGAGIPQEFYVWVDRARPLSVAAPQGLLDLTEYLASRGIAPFDLGRTGALNFRRKGSRLELASFLNGAMGFYSYL